LCALAWAALETLVAARFFDTLADVIDLFEGTKSTAFVHLAKPDVAPQSAYMVLQALGGTGVSAA
jgi:hypothetical protein